MIRLLRFATVAISVIIAGNLGAAIRRGKPKPDMTRYQNTAADHDFNGDSFGDLLYRNPTSRSIDAALQIGTHPIGKFNAGTLGPESAIEGFGDFDRDGHADFVVRNTVTGDVQIWLVSASGVTKVPVGGLAPGLRIVGIGDFDGDGNRDIVARDDAANSTVVWLMDKTALRNAAMVSAIPGITSSSWIAGVGDVDGDGRSDIIWSDRKTMTIMISFMNGSTARRTIDQGPVTAGYVLEAVADFDGDRKADLFFRNSTKGRWVIVLLDGAAIKKSVEMIVSEQGRLGAVADLDFDGKSDLVFQSDKGPLLVYLMKGTTYYKVSMPNEFPDSQLIGTR